MRSHNPYPHDVWMTQARSAVSTMLAELGDRYTRYLTPGAYASLLAKYERPADNGGRRALGHADNLDRARARHVALGHAGGGIKVPVLLGRLRVDLLSRASNDVAPLILGVFGAGLELVQF